MRSGSYPPAMAGRITNRVALADGRVQPVEHADVLVVEIDVDVAVELAVVGEQLVWVAGWGSARSRSTSPTLPPGAQTSRSPPTEARSTGGILIVAIAE